VLQFFWEALQFAEKTSTTHAGVAARYRAEKLVEE